MDYKGIKIYNKLIIVERTSNTEGGYNWKGRTINQGYIVDIGNKKSLENALNWAKWTYTDTDLVNKYWKIRDKFGSDSLEAKEAKAAYEATKTTYNGIVHEYINGQFEITLDEAADGSSQGGKLSFWNCIITAPDGKNFLIGINSELLLHLMMATTLVNGKCQEKVWLGRVGGTQVGVFTENMEDFKQAKLDEQQRQAVKTGSVKYIPGDIVKTLKEKELYLGEAYQYYHFESGWNYKNHYIVIYDTPKLVHVFRKFHTYNFSYEPKKESLSESYECKVTKPKRIIDGHIDLNYLPHEYIKEYNTKQLNYYLEKQKSDKWYKDSRYSWEYAKNLKMYGNSPTMSKDDILQFLEDTYKEHCSKWHSSIQSEFKIITESEWEKIKN